MVPWCGISIVILVSGVDSLFMPCVSLTRVTILFLESFTRERCMRQYVSPRRQCLHTPSQAALDSAADVTLHQVPNGSYYICTVYIYIATLMCVWMYIEYVEYI